MLHYFNICLKDEVQKRVIVITVIICENSKCLSRHLMRLLENNYNKGKYYVSDVNFRDLFGNYKKKPALYHSDVKEVVWGL